MFLEHLSKFRGGSILCRHREDIDGQFPSHHAEPALMVLFRYDFFHEFLEKLLWSQPVVYEGLFVLESIYFVKHIEGVICSRGVFGAVIRCKSPGP